MNDHPTQSGEAAPLTGNDILGRIPGEVVGAALNALPKPTRDGPEEQQVVVEAGQLGRVRIYAVRKLARHHKSSHLYWCAYRAEPER